MLDPVEQRTLESVFLPPSVRNEVEQDLAELALVTSQRPARKTVKEGARKVPKATRAEKAAAWRRNLGKNMKASTLAQLVPYSKEKKKQVKHSFMKALGGRFKLL